MTASTLPPQVMGQRTQISTLELGIGASLAAVAVLGVTLFAAANGSDESGIPSHSAPSSAVTAVP